MEDLPNQQEESGDLRAIRLGIEQAEAEERNIDDATARRIASQLHTGQTSAMYSLASSGAVDYERVSAEIAAEYRLPDTDDEQRRMYDHVGTYAVEHEGRGPVEGWFKLTADQAEDGEDQALWPAVWVGCLASQARGIRHGLWLDALREPDELEEDVEIMLASSPVPDASEAFIDDVRGFQGLEISEYASMKTVAELARLVDLHGEPFVHWLNHTGYRDHAELGPRFEDAYKGSFDDGETFVDYVLRESGAYQFFDFAPEDLRQYVHFDLKAIAEAWESDHLLLIDSRDGESVYAYDHRV